MTQRRILLADADAFFVAVARMVDPEGAGKAALLIVGGTRESRGVVCSASYEARKYGVRSAMPISRALRLCPAAMCVPVPRGACSGKSHEIRDALARFAPIVESASIDEWYLDLGGTERAHHRRGDVGIFAQRSVRAPQDRHDPGGRRLLARRMYVEVRAQVRLLLGHRLEQQPLLRCEVPVHGPERDVGRGRHVAHLDRVESTLGRELQGRVEHPPAAGRLTARERPLGGGLGFGLDDGHGRNWNTF